MTESQYTFNHAQGQADALVGLGSARSDSGAAGVGLVSRCISHRWQVEVELLRRDCRVKRVWSGGCSGRRRRSGAGAPRGQIVGFSDASRRRLLRVLRNGPEWEGLIDLTYPRDFPSDGAKVRRDRDVFLKRLRRRVRGLAYLWVLEFQVRGAPHIHVCVAGPGVGRLVRSAAFYALVARWWFEIVGSGDVRHLHAGTRVSVVRSSQGVAHYLAKYLRKCSQKEVPDGYVNVGRFWGASRGLVQVVLRVAGSVLELAGLVRCLARKRQADIRAWYGRKVRRHGGRGFWCYNGAMVACRLLGIGGALWGELLGLSGTSGGFALSGAME